MGKLISFDIVFANQPPIFYSGQSVSGTVVVNLRDAMKMRGIRARIHGRAYCHVEVERTREYDDGQGGVRTETYKEYFREYETYLDHQATIFGKEVGDRHGQNPVLPAGQHAFNFSFVLPPHLKMPSSVELGHCNIRYMIVATIDKPWKFDHTAKRAFTLLESIDCNDPALCQRPFPMENEKFLCCLCCKSGPLKVTASIDRSGYCPGEGILLNAECENLTNRKMRGVRAKLVRHVQWKARGHSDFRTSDYFEIKSPGEIDEGDTFSWSNQLIQIPAVTPTITSCGLIAVKYEFQVAVIVPGGLNLNLTFPITIGTIPLRPAGMAAPPPFYRESIDGAMEIREHDDHEYIMGGLMFAPMYAYANNYQPIPVQAPAPPVGMPPVSQQPLPPPSGAAYPPGAPVPGAVPGGPPGAPPGAAYPPGPPQSNVA